MNHRERIELERLAVNIRDDAERAEDMGRGTIGIWALMSYADRIEKLLKEQRESSE